MIVDIDTRKLSFNAFIKPRIDYVSVVWGSRSDVVGEKKDYILCTEKLSLKFICPDATLTADQNLKETRRMSLRQQLQYNKDLFLYMVLNNEAPANIANCARTLHHAIPMITLVFLGRG